MPPPKLTPTDDVLGVSRTYFTEFDPFAQQLHPENVTRDELAVKLKLAAMFNDTVTVAASHLVQSPVTYEVLLEHAPLLEDGTIVPVINRTFDSFTEMVDEKSTDPEAYGGVRFGTDVETARERAVELDALTRHFLGFDLEGMSTPFEESLSQALSDTDTDLHQRIATVADPAEIRADLDAMETVTRTRIQELTADLPAPARQALMDYVAVNYHLSGGAYHRAAVNVPAPELEALAQKIDHAVPGTQSMAEQPASLPGFVDMMNVLALDRSAVDDASAARLLDLRTDSAGENYREKLNEYITDIDSYAGDEPRELRAQRDEFEETVRSVVDADANPRPENRAPMLEANLHTTTLRHQLGRGRSVSDITDPVLEELSSNIGEFRGSEFLVSEERAVPDSQRSD